jgi:hypothetical protein
MSQTALVQRPIRAALLLKIVGGTLGLAGLTSSALAQDSVSTTAGLPGDAPSAYTTGSQQQQILNYVVDAPMITTSWGNRYRIAPIVKASRSIATSPQYFNNLIASTVISNTFNAPAVPFRASYRLWNQAGGGVNPTSNNLALSPTIVPAGLVGPQFSVAFLDFAGGPNGTFGDADDDNNIITALVSHANAWNGRLYVSRVVTATNKSSATAFNANASFGLGSVDERGNTAFAADGFNMTLGDDPIVNKQLFRVASTSRVSSANNQVTNSTFGDSAASRRLGSNTSNTTTPTLIGASLGTGARPVAMYADFNNLYYTEANLGSLSFVNGWQTASTFARGPISFSATPFSRVNPGSTNVGVGATLARGPSATKTRALAVWGINSNAAPTSALRVDLPTDSSTLIDQNDNFNPATAFGSLANQELTNYQSQVAFRGANGPVALSVLPGSGDLLLAAGVAATGPGAGVPQSMDSYIAVARVNAATGAVSWTIAAHSGGPTGSAGGNAKAIFDGSGTAIGSTARYNEVFPTATGGPSISAPAMDRFGNVYVMSSVRLFRPPINNVNNDLFTVALLRANLDPATNQYRLELITKLNDVLRGLNSDRNYEIAYFGPADGDSVDSGALWHSSVCQDINPRISSTTSLPYGSPLTLGALTFRAKVIYDFNQDGIFSDPSTPPGGTSPDQAYNVAMVILPAFRPADIGDNGSNPGPDGNVDNGDFSLFISAFFSGDPVADIADNGSNPGPDGNVDNGDFSLFISSFFGSF